MATRLVGRAALPWNTTFRHGSFQKSGAPNIQSPQTRNASYKYGKNRLLKSYPKQSVYLSQNRGPGILEQPDGNLGRLVFVGFDHIRI